MPADPIVFDTFSDLAPWVGQVVTTTDWRCIDQDRIQRFAEATDDHQWIHLDVERARRESPYGTTIAHGFLTLSMVAEFLQESIQCRSAQRGINYGLNKVRFPAPVPSGSMIRAQLTLQALEHLPQEAAVQLTWGVVIEVQGQTKPACVAEMLTRWYA